MNPALIPIFLRELIAARTLPREPEPDLVMDTPEQVSAYAEGGRIDGLLAAAYLFHSARISQVIQGCATVLDLGCGPANQLAHIADMNPEVRFTGIDLSSTMLADARKHAASLGLANINFRIGDIVYLKGVADHSVDAVISTMAFHHLPTLGHLETCFASIRRVLKPGGRLYLTDFGRLKSLKSVNFFANMNARHQSPILSLDYERSLRAAFLREEFEALAVKYFPHDIKTVSTFKIPLLVIIKTIDHPLPDTLRRRLAAMRKALKPQYRRDLDDIRLFLALDGLRNDPFTGI
jgi:ubiquinone/menaquinone biosynthesis C-methylase UbiE